MWKCLTFEHTEKNKNIGYDKVIMLAGGIGFGKEDETMKKIKEGDYVVVLEVIIIELEWEEEQYHHWIPENLKIS